MRKKPFGIPRNLKLVLNFFDDQCSRFLNYLEGCLDYSLPVAIDVPGLRQMQSVCQNSDGQSLSGVPIHIGAGEAGIAKALSRIELAQHNFLWNTYR